jgi:hypothetical protein
MGISTQQETYSRRISINIGPTIQQLIRTTQQHRKHETYKK